MNQNPIDFTFVILQTLVGQPDNYRPKYFNVDYCQISSDPLKCRSPILKNKAHKVSQMSEN